MPGRRSPRRRPVPGPPGHARPHALQPTGALGRAARDLVHAPGPARLRGLLALGLLLALLPACASLDGDWHLAPGFSRLHRMDGGRTTELFAGMVLAEDPPTRTLDDGTEVPVRRRLADGEPDELWGRRVRVLRPLTGQTWHAEGEDRTFEWLPPLGRTAWRGEELSSYFFPIYSARTNPANQKGRTFQMVVLPGFLWTREASGSNHVAWIPIYGDLRDFLTFSRIHFVLFPLYVRTERAGNRTDNLLFPVLSWTRPIPEDEVTDPVAQLERRELHAWRVWPLYGTARRDGSYDRHFALWPIGHWQTNHLERDEDQREHLSAVWPLFTSTRMGTYRGYTVLWPFFGWAHDPRGAETEGGEAFWALDAPWPLVRFQRGGKGEDPVSRSRIWPFFSHMKGDKLEAWSMAWPFVQWRTEDYLRYDRKSLYLLPFWRAWHAREAGPDGGAPFGERLADGTWSEAGPTIGRWRKLWPLWSEELAPGRHGLRRTTTLLPLNPLWELDFLDLHWAWLWQLYREVEDGPLKRERSWGGLWVRERNAAEDRRSLAGLWSRRVVDAPGVHGQAGGGRYTETSLLFGLIRWRSSDAADDSGMLAPAFPGPGWPALVQPAPAAPPALTPMVFPAAPDDDVPPSGTDGADATPGPLTTP